MHNDGVEGVEHYIMFFDGDCVVSQDLHDVPGNHGSMLWGYQKGSNSNGLRLPQQASTWSSLAQHCNYRGAHLRAGDSYNVINMYLAGKSKQ